MKLKLDAINSVFWRTFTILTLGVFVFLSTSKSFGFVCGSTCSIKPGQDVPEISNGLPPMVLKQVTSYYQTAMDSKDDRFKAQVVEAMNKPLSGLPPCRIMTTNSIFEIAQSGDRQLKEKAYEVLYRAHKKNGFNPIPGFMMADVNLRAKLSHLAKDLGYSSDMAPEAAADVSLEGLDDLSKYKPENSSNSGAQ